MQGDRASLGLFHFLLLLINIWGHSDKANLLFPTSCAKQHKRV